MCLPPKPKQKLQQRTWTQREVSSDPLTTKWLYFIRYVPSVLWYMHWTYHGEFFSSICLLTFNKERMYSLPLNMMTNSAVCWLSAKACHGLTPDRNEQFLSTRLPFFHPNLPCDNVETDVLVNYIEVLFWGLASLTLTFRQIAFQGRRSLSLWPSEWIGDSWMHLPFLSCFSKVRAWGSVPTWHSLLRQPDPNTTHIHPSLFHGWRFQSSSIPCPQPTTMNLLEEPFCSVSLSLSLPPPPIFHCFTVNIGICPCFLLTHCSYCVQNKDTDCSLSSRCIKLLRNVPLTLNLYSDLQDIDSQCRRPSYIIVPIFSSVQKA